MSLFVGSTGAGFGIPASGMTRRDGRRPQRWARPRPGGDYRRDHSRHRTTSCPARGHRRSIALWGLAPDGRPLVVHMLSRRSVKELAAVVRSPMGIEWLPPEERQGFLPPGFEGVTLTGMTLQNALATLVALDPRYEWRDLDGVIVFRPVTAWREPLESPVPHRQWRPSRGHHGGEGYRRIHVTRRLTGARSQQLPGYSSVHRRRSAGDACSIC